MRREFRLLLNLLKEERRTSRRIACAGALLALASAASIVATFCNIDGGPERAAYIVAAANCLIGLLSAVTLVTIRSVQQRVSTFRYLILVLWDQLFVIPPVTSPLQNDLSKAAAQLIGK